MRLIDADVMIDILRKSHESHATSGRHRRVFGSKAKWVNSEALREKIAQARLVDEADPAAAVNAILDQMEDG